MAVALSSSVIVVATNKSMLISLAFREVRPAYAHLDDAYESRHGRRGDPIGVELPPSLALNPSLGALECAVTGRIPVYALLDSTDGNRQAY